MSNVINLPGSGASDRTDRRIQAFLASVGPLRGLPVSEGVNRGRSIIERMAMSADGEGDPAIRLSPQHCADVLEFLSRVEALEPKNWWTEPAESPSHLVGYQIVLQTLEANLRLDAVSDRLPSETASAQMVLAGKGKDGPPETLMDNPIDGHPLMGVVDRIAGVVRLASDAVEAEAGTNETLAAAWCSLDLALESLQALRYDLEGVPKNLRGDVGLTGDEPEFPELTGQDLYDEVVTQEREIKALLDEIPYATLGNDPGSCSALDSAETHLRDAVAQLRKAHAIECARVKHEEDAT
jgi:hypothetical protein